MNVDVEKRPAHARSTIGGRIAAEQGINSSSVSSPRMGSKSSRRLVAFAGAGFFARALVAGQQACRRGFEGAAVRGGLAGKLGRNMTGADLLRLFYGGEGQRHLRSVPNNFAAVNGRARERGGID
jgi:hypothetical protein